jgi:glycosyltransferase involved in cell wall biosynthesis
LWSRLEGDRMRILWIGMNDEYCISSRLYYFRQALARHCDLIEFGKGFSKKYRAVNDVRELVKEHDPDAIFFRGGPSIRWKIENINWTGLPDITVPKFLNYSDPQGIRPRNVRLEWINHNKIDVTLHVARGINPALRYAPEVSIDKFRELAFDGHRAIWFPPCVDVNVFRDEGLERVYDLCLLGRVWAIYGLRKKMWRVFLDRGQITKWEYPEEHIHTYKDMDMKIYHRPRIKYSWSWTPKQRARALTKGFKIMIHEDYSNIIKQSKIYPMGGSNYLYASMKYFEAMACQTAVVANMPLDGPDLHFEDGYNMVEVNRNNFEEETYKLLKDDTRREELTRNAVDTIHKYHTTDIRAKQLIKFIKEEF